MFRRTWRELILIGVGLFFCGFELLQEPTTVRNLAVYALATTLFSLRFFAARGVGVGVALGAIAQRWPVLRNAEVHEPVSWIWFAPFFVLALLCSRELEEKFERAPSPYAWLPNFWQDLPIEVLRPLRWCMYSLGMLAALLVQISAWNPTSNMLWAHAATGAISVLLVILALGRAAALLLVPIVTGAVLWVSVPEVLHAEQSLRTGGYASLGMLARSSEYVLPIVLTAATSFVLSSWFSLRLLTRIARSNG